MRSLCVRGWVCCWRTCIGSLCRPGPCGRPPARRAGGCHLICAPPHSTDARSTTACAARRCSHCRGPPCVGMTRGGSTSVAGAQSVCGDGVRLHHRDGGLPPAEGAGAARWRGLVGIRKSWKQIQPIRPAQMRLVKISASVACQVLVGTWTRSAEIFAPRCVSGSVAHLLPLSRCCRVTLCCRMTSSRREPFFAPRACLARTTF